MSNTLGGALEFEFDIDTSELGAKRKAVENEIRGMTRNITGETSKMDKGFKMAFAGLAAYGVGNVIGNMAQQVIAVRSEFEKMGAVLTNTLGSKSAANKALADIKEFASTTPFQVQELTSSFVKLANQGFTPTIAQLTSLGDIAASQGKSFDQLTEAIIDASGAMEFERLKEFGIRAQKDGEKIIFTFKGQAKAVEANSAAIREYILSLGNAQGVQGSMAAISKTTAGQISNLKDSWDNLLNTIGTKTGGATSLGIKGIKSLVEGLNDLLDSTVKISSADYISDFTGNISREVTSLNSLFETAKKAGEGTEARKLAIDEINKVYGQYIGNLDTEKTTLGELETAQKKATDALIKDLAVKAKSADIVDVQQKNIENEKKIVKGILDDVNEVGGNMTAASIRLNQMFDKFGTSTRQGISKMTMSFIKDFNLSAKLYGPENLIDPLLEVYNSRQERDKAIKEIEAYYTAIAGQIDESVKTVNSGKDPKTGKVSTADPLKEFEKYLKETKSLYEQYDITKAVFGADEANSIFKNLKALGEDYYDFLIHLNANATIEQKPLLAVELKPFMDDIKKKAKEEELFLQLKDIKLDDAENIDKIAQQMIEDIQDAIAEMDDSIFKSNEDKLNIQKGLLSQYGSMKQRQLMDLSAMEADFEKAGLKYEKDANTGKLKETKAYTRAKGQINAGYFEEAMGYANAAADAISIFDKEAGQTINNMANGASQLMAGIMSGDILGAIQGGISLLATFASTFDDSARKEEERKKRWEAFTTYIQMANDALERQLTLVSEINGIEGKGSVLDSARASAEKDLKKYSELLAGWGKTFNEIAANQNSSEIVLAGTLKGDANPQKLLQDLLAKYDEATSEGLRNIKKDLMEAGYNNWNSDELQTIIDAYDEIDEKLKEISDTQKEVFTGNTYSELIDGLTSMFDDGIASAQEFSDNFQEIMKRAIMNSFEQEFIREQMKGWYDEFYQLSKDGLNAEDTAKLKESLQTITTSAQEGIKQLQEATGINLAQEAQTESSLSGAVKQIQEDTANILAGQMNAIRITVLENRSIAMNSYNQLVAIERNTFPLHEIRDILKSGSDLTLINNRANGI